MATTTRSPGCTRAITVQIATKRGLPHLGLRCPLVPAHGVRGRRRPSSNRTTTPPGPNPRTTNPETYFFGVGSPSDSTVVDSCVSRGSHGGRRFSRRDNRETQRSLEGWVLKESVLTEFHASTASGEHVRDERSEHSDGDLNSVSLLTTLASLPVRISVYSHNQTRSRDTAVSRRLGSKGKRPDGDLNSGPWLRKPRG